MAPNFEMFFETTVRAFLGDKAYHIADQAHSEKNRRDWYKKIMKVIVKKVHEIETTTKHKEQLVLWAEKALEKISNRNYSESELNLCLFRLIAALLGFMGLRPYNIATLAYFQTQPQHITQVISEGGDTMQDCYDEKNAIAIRQKIIKQLKEEGLSDYHISLVLNVSEYQIQKLRKNL